MTTKSKIILLLFAILCSPSIAQNSRVDSLKQQLTMASGADLVPTLCFLSEHLLDSLPDQSLQYLMQAKKISDSLNDNAGKIKVFYSMGVYKNFIEDFTDAKQYFDSAMALNPADDIQQKMLIYMGYGETFYQTLEYDSALKYLDIAKTLAEHNEDTSSLSAIYNNYAKTADKQGKRNIAIEYYLRAAEMFFILKKEKPLAMVYNNLGTINLSFKNYPQALHYFFESVQLYKKLGFPGNLATLYSNIGVAYYRSDSLPQAEKYYLKSLSYSRQNNSQSENARTFMNLANLNSKQKKYEIAAGYYDSSLQICIDHNIAYGIMLNKVNLGELQYNLMNYNKAAQYMESALPLLKSYQLPEEETELYLMLYKTYLKLGNDSQALRNLEKHYALRDSIAGEESNKLLLELQAKYENEKKQKELAVLQQEKLTIENKQRIIIIISLVAFLVLVSFFFYLYYRHRRAVFLKNLAEKDKMILETKLDTKDQELANFAMHLARNYETSARISSEIKDILPLADKSKSGQLGKLVHDLDVISNTDVWKEFEIRFEQVHKEFFHILKELHPDLTPVELKVCSLLRLNMNTKDIAALTNRSIRTIENNRTSIRKKLNLNPQTNLSSYLLSI